MKGRYITNEVRVLSGDRVLSGMSEADCRFRDAELTRWLNQAQKAIRENRPDSRVALNGSLVDYKPLVDLDNDDLVVADNYEDALINYVLSKLYGQDETDAENMELSARHYKSYYNNLGV